jgi:hypothetical protein
VCSTYTVTPAMWKETSQCNSSGITKAISTPVIAALAPAAARHHQREQPTADCSGIVPRSRCNRRLSSSSDGPGKILQQCTSFDMSLQAIFGSWRLKSSTIGSSRIAAKVCRSATAVHSVAMARRCERTSCAKQTLVHAQCLQAQGGDGRLSADWRLFVFRVGNGRAIRVTAILALPHLVLLFEVGLAKLLSPFVEVL